MSSKPNTLASAFIIVLLILAISALAPASQRRGSRGKVASRQTAQGAATAGHAQALAAFEGRVKQYARLRERLEEKLPKLPKDAAAEQIEVHKETFREVVRNARAGVKRGNVFTPEAAAAVRHLLKGELDGEDKRELREKVSEAETQGVLMRVNYPYPETQELVDIPPTVLLKLPQLPKQVKYRFVGRNLLLVDRENGLIVDFMPDALP
jgi:hypothetical protein